MNKLKKGLCLAVLLSLGMGLSLNAKSYTDHVGDASYAGGTALAKTGESIARAIVKPNMSKSYLLPVLGWAGYQGFQQYLISQDNKGADTPKLDKVSRFVSDWSMPIGIAYYSWLAGYTEDGTLEENSDIFSGNVEDNYIRLQENVKQSIECVIGAIELLSK